jgi:hypothetical protein
MRAIGRLHIGHGLAIVVAAGLLTACPGQPTSRDHNDTTPPVLTFSIAGTAQNPGGIDDIAFGTTTALSPAGAQLLIKATDDNGVSFVELWLTEKKECAGVIVGPGLAGAPSARTVGTVTPTQAPSSLTAAFKIEATNRQRGCIFTFDVWGKAQNAADTPVPVTSPHATVTLQT